MKLIFCLPFLLASAAATAGFGSAAYLRNLFRKRFGMTMRQWRIKSLALNRK